MRNAETVTNAPMPPKKKKGAEEEEVPVIELRVGAPVARPSAPVPPIVAYTATPASVLPEWDEEALAAEDRRALEDDDGEALRSSTRAPSTPVAMPASSSALT